MRCKYLENNKNKDTYNMQLHESWHIKNSPPEMGKKPRKTDFFSLLEDADRIFGAHTFTPEKLLLTSFNLTLT